MAQINTKSLEAWITRVDMRLDNLRTNIRWREEGSQLAQKPDIEQEITALYQIQAEFGKMLLDFQKEWNRGNY